MASAHRNRKALHLSINEAKRAGDLPQRPVIQSRWRLQGQQQDLYFFGTEGDYKILRGSLFNRLFPLLDGHRTQSEVVRAVSSEIPEAQVLAALQCLHAENMLDEGPRSSPREAAWWELMGVEQPGSLRCFPIDLICLDGIDPEQIEVCIQLAGMKISSESAFKLVLAEDYLSGNLDHLNRDALAGGTPWMLVRPFGRRHWIGPLFIPGETPCWKCLAHQLERNGWTSAASFASSPCAGLSTISLAVTQAAICQVTGANRAIAGKILEFDTGNASVTEHIVNRRPQCPACGNGGHSSRSPISRNEPRKHISPLTGFVRGIRRAWSSPGFHLYVAEGSEALRPDSTGGKFYCSRPLYIGKGRTPALARAKCFGEAVERYSSQFHGDEPRVLASRRELGPSAPDPRTIMGFSETQYARRTESADGQRPRDRVPEPFADSTRREWVSAKSLLTNRSVYLPAGFCLLGYGDPSCSSDTNGCASAPTFDRACLNAILELVERDAVAIWWYNRIRRPALDLTRFSSPAIARLTNLIADLDHRVHVLDLTTDFEIPVLAAIAISDTGNFHIGCASSLRVATALWKSLADVCMSLLYPRTEAPGDALHTERPQLFPAEAPLTGPAAFTAVPPAAPSKHLACCLRAVERLHLDAFAVDTKRPEVGIPAARVVIPGTSHWTPRFGHDRLYSVPAALGWKSRRAREEDLNPEPFPF